MKNILRLFKPDDKVKMKKDTMYPKMKSSGLKGNETFIVYRVAPKFAAKERYEELTEYYNWEHGMEIRATTTGELFWVKQQDVELIE